MLSNHRHRIAGIDHFRKDDQFRTGIFRTRSEIVNRAQIRLQISRGAGNLGSGDFHKEMLILAQGFIQSANLQRFRPPLRHTENDENGPDSTTDDRENRAKQRGG